MDWRVLIKIYRITIWSVETFSWLIELAWFSILEPVACMFLNSNLYHFEQCLKHFIDIKIYS